MFFKHHRNFSVARNLSHFLIMSPHNLCKYFIQLCEYFKCHLKLDDWFASVIMDALKRTPNTFITFECSPLDFWIIARKRNWLFIFKWFHNVRKKRVIMLQINSVMNSPRLHDTGLKYLFIFFFWTFLFNVSNVFNGIVDHNIFNQICMVSNFQKNTFLINM